MRHPEQKYDPITWHQVIMYSEDLTSNNIITGSESKRILSVIGDPGKALELLAELAISKHLENIFIAEEFKDSSEVIEEMESIESLDKETIKNRLNRLHNKYSFRNIGEGTQALGLVIMSTALFMYGKNTEHDFKPNTPSEYRDLIIMMIGATAIALGRVIVHKNSKIDEDY